MVLSPNDNRETRGAGIIFADVQENWLPLAALSEMSRNHRPAYGRVFADMLGCLVPLNCVGMAVSVGIGVGVDVTVGVGGMNQVSVGTTVSVAFGISVLVAVSAETNTISVARDSIWAMIASEPGRSTIGPPGLHAETTTRIASKNNDFLMSYSCRYADQ